MRLTPPALPVTPKVRVTVRDLAAGGSKTITLYETNKEEVIARLQKDASAGPRRTRRAIAD